MFLNHPIFISDDAAPGSAAIRNFSVSLHSSLEIDQSLASELTLFHELVHYLQFVATLDGATWYLYNYFWENDLMSELREFKGQLSLPIIEQPKSIFPQTHESFNIYHHDESLFINGKQSDVYPLPPMPLIEITSNLKFRLTGRHIYEGFAFLNELIFIDPNYLFAERLKLNTEEIPEVYIWPIYIINKLSINVATMLCLLDYALMRPAMGWMKFGFDQAIPAFRFVIALKLIISNQITQTNAISEFIDFQNLISDELGWMSPKDMVEEFSPIFDFVWEKMDPYRIPLDQLKDDKLVNDFVGGGRKEYNLDLIRSTMAIRKLERTGSAIFICPGMLGFKSFEYFHPPFIYHRPESAIIFSDNYSSERMGADSLHIIKLEIARELMLSKQINCITKYSQGECPIDPSCPGHFPRPDKRIPNCGFTDHFQNRFHHSLAELNGD